MSDQPDNEPGNQPGTPEQRAEMHRVWADVASFMLAASDDPSGWRSAIATLTYADAAKLVVAAVEMGGRLVALDGQVGARDYVTAVARHLQDGIG